MILERFKVPAKDQVLSKAHLLRTTRTLEHVIQWLGQCASGLRWAPLAAGGRA
jgi:hypothetical protein